MKLGLGRAFAGAGIVGDDLSAVHQAQLTALVAFGQQGLFLI